MPIRSLVAVVILLLGESSYATASATGFSVAPKFRPLVDAHRLRFSEVKNLGEAAALKYAAEKLEVVQALTKPARDPYSNQLSLPERCRAESLPRPLDVKDRSGFTKAVSLYSSDNLVLGSCGQAGGVKSQQILLYCRKIRTLYVISVFFDPADDWPGEAVVRCG